MEGNNDQIEWQKLVNTIRDELDRSLKPVNDGLADIKRELANHYNREMVDLLLKGRDEEIHTLQDEVGKLQASVGSLWWNTVMKVGAGAGAIAAVIEAWRLLH